MRVGLGFTIGSPDLVEHFGIAGFDVLLEVELELARKVQSGDDTFLKHALGALTDFGSEDKTPFGLCYEVTKRMFMTFGTDLQGVAVRYMTGVRITVSAELFAMEWLRGAGRKDFLINPVERVAEMFASGNIIELAGVSTEAKDV